MRLRSVAVAAALLIAGCSKVTQDNFAKIQEGMKRATGDRAARQPERIGKDAVITVSFVNRKVALKTFRQAGRATEIEKGRPKAPFPSSPRWLAPAFSFVVALARFVADHATNDRSADGADGAAAGRRRADRAAGHRAADRADGLARGTVIAGATRHASCENDANCDKKLPHVMASGCKKNLALSRSGAAAQQENYEQDGDGHAKGPQQDVTQLAFLLPSPLLQLFHI